MANDTVIHDSDILGGEKEKMSHLEDGQPLHLTVRIDLHLILCLLDKMELILLVGIDGARTRNTEEAPAENGLHHYAARCSGVSHELY